MAAVAAAHIDDNCGTNDPGMTITDNESEPSSLSDNSDPKNQENGQFNEKIQTKTDKTMDGDGKTTQAEAPRVMEIDETDQKHSAEAIPNISPHHPPDDQAFAAIYDQHINKMQQQGRTSIILTSRAERYYALRARRDQINIREINGKQLKQQKLQFSNHAPNPTETKIHTNAPPPTSTDEPAARQPPTTGNKTTPAWKNTHNPHNKVRFTPSTITHSRSNKGPQRIQRKKTQQQHSPQPHLNNKKSNNERSTSNNNATAQHGQEGQPSFRAVYDARQFPTVTNKAKYKVVTQLGYGRQQYRLPEILATLLRELHKEDKAIHIRTELGHYMADADGIPPSSLIRHHFPAFFGRYKYRQDNATIIVCIRSNIPFTQVEKICNDALRPLRTLVNYLVPEEENTRVVGFLVQSDVRHIDKEHARSLLADSIQRLATDDEKTALRNFGRQDSLTQIKIHSKTSNYHRRVQVKVFSITCVKGAVPLPRTILARRADQDVQGRKDGLGTKKPARQARGPPSQGLQCPPSSPKRVLRTTWPHRINGYQA